MYYQLSTLACHPAQNLLLEGKQYVVDVDVEEVEHLRRKVC